MNEQWKELKETIVELRDSDGTGTQQEVCKFLANYMDILEKQMQEPSEDEYIKVPKKALKYRTAGMVAYNAEWLKNNFDIERAVICGAQEPCEDAISRQTVMEHYSTGELAHCNHISRNNLLDFIEQLPPVTPQPKMGRWIYGEDNLGTGRDGWYCNQCGHFEFWDYSSDMNNAKLNLPNPCPNCGAKMVESQEKRDEGK